VGVLSEFCNSTLSEADIIRAPYTDNAYLLFDDIREFNYTYAYDNHFLGRGYRTVEDRIASYSAVTPESIKAVAKEIFRSSNLTLTAKAKKKKVDASRLSDIVSSL
jgi:predicted Zn-dependent peptidase